ncbi:unnamed protein product [Effrenium voratum]|nr:unnamed protein product [Effrenium voratum]
MGSIRQVELTKDIKAKQWHVAASLVCAAVAASVTLNIIIYTALVNTSAQSHWQECTRLLSDLRHGALQADHQLCNAAGRACAEWRRLLLQLWHFQACGMAVDAHGASAAARACAGWRAAFALLQAWTKAALQATVVNHNVAVTRLEKVSKWQPSLEILTEMQRKAVERTVISLASAISACGAGHWQRAVALLRSCPCLQPNVIACNAAISACEKQGQWQQAIGLLAEMELLRLQEDVISHNAVISACEKGGLWERALAVLARMRSRRVRATEVTRSAVVSACATARRWREALWALRALRPRRGSHDFEASANAANAANAASAANAANAATNAGISACARAWDSALQLLRHMPAEALQPDLVSFNAALSACRWRQIVDLLASIRCRGLEKDVITYEAAVWGFEKASRSREAVALLRDLDVLRRVFQATLDIQACGRLLEGPERRTPQMSPQASMQDMQEALHPKRNESNVEQLLREWDSLKKVGSQNMAPAVLLSEQERVTVESALDNAELMALKHAEISGWFFDRRTGERWLAAKVAEICRGNLAEWMAWAFFHCTPDEVPPQRREEMTKLIEEGVQWAGVDFPPGYNPHVQAMRLTMDPIPSEHRPLAYYIVTALAMPVVNGYNLEHLGFHAHRSGTLWYWLRRGRGRQGAEPPLVFCHGVGVNLLPYVHFINELLRQVPRGKDIFLVSLPHISMRIKEDVPSSTEMVACLRDMLASWEHTSAHFIGHSFGSIVVAWMARNAKEMVSVATFLDPVCFLLIKPDVCYNFMYRQPQTATQLLMHYFVARELFIAHSLSRNFFWHQNLLWPEELDMPCMVMLSGEDSIVPAHSVRRYLTGWIQKIRANKQDTFRLLWFPNLGHGEMNFGPVGLAACKRIVAEMMSLEARLSCS